MSIETLLEAAKFVELSTSLQSTRVGDDDGFDTNKLPANNEGSPFETRKSLHYISPPRSSSKPLKQQAAEKKKDDKNHDDLCDEIEVSSSGNLSNSDFSGDPSEKRRQGGAGTREVHNKLEKNRRAHLKECFEGLRYQIPNMQDHKVSNLSILRGAFRFVQILKRKEKELEHELERLVHHKVEVQNRLLQLKNDAIQHSDIGDKILKHSKSPGKKRVKKAKRKRKLAVVHQREHDVDDGASTSTASEAEEEERRSRAHSPVSGTREICEPKQGMKLQKILTTSPSVPGSLGHTSVIHSTGQPKHQLRAVTLPNHQGHLRLPPASAVVVDNGQSVISRAGDPLITSSLRPTVSQLLNKGTSFGTIPPKNVPGAAPKLHIIHTGANGGGIKQQESLMVTKPTVTMLTTTKQPGTTVSSASVGTNQNGKQTPTMLASALAGHLVQTEHRVLGNVSVAQTTITSSLITTAIAQPVMAALPTQHVYKTGTVRPGLAGASLPVSYTQIPFNPAITQVLLTQPSIATYTLTRQVPISHPLLRQTLTPMNSKYAFSSTSPVTVMISQKTIVSPRSTSPTASTATTVAKDVRVDHTLTGGTTVLVPTTQSISVPRIIPTAYLQTVRPGVHRLPLQQPVTTCATPVLKAYHQMYIPRYRTIGSVISSQKPLGVGVGPKLGSQQAGNGHTATIIVQSPLVNTVDKPKQG